jgi:hypothetical protein
MTPIIIDQKFKDLISPLGEDEYRQLEENILREECRDPLVVWLERNILLDGHHRHAICSKHNKEFKVVALSFPDELAAEEWMLQNQLGRRNLSTEMTAYLRGRLYETRKKREGRPEKLGQSVLVSGATRDELAETTGVVGRTIQRDAAFAKAVDIVAKTAGKEAKDLILSGRSGLSRDRIKRLATQAPDKIEFEMQVRRERAASTREDREDLDADQIEESAEISGKLKKDRQLKKLEVIHRLSSAWDSFMSFIIKARGDEAPETMMPDWCLEEGEWLYERSGEAIAELQSWRVAIEKQFPALKYRKFRAVN